VPKTKLDKVRDLAKEATDTARLSLKEVAEKAAEVLDPGKASVPAKAKSGRLKKSAPKAKRSATKSKTAASAKAPAKRSTRAAKSSK
jgi:hypothetical protein